jgi:nucleotide-binding universal stress UspA family protein
MRRPRTPIGPRSSITSPIDFSVHAAEAFRTACDLARAIGTEAIVFHIAQPLAIVGKDGRLVTDPEKGKTTSLWDRFDYNHPGAPGVRVEHEVIVYARPSAKHIFHILDQLGCDLIVMGMRRRSFFKQLLFGSVVDEVVRCARCPVTVVKAPTPARERPDAQALPATKA